MGICPTRRPDVPLPRSRSAHSEGAMTEFSIGHLAGNPDHAKSANQKFEGVSFGSHNYLKTQRISKIFGSK